MAFNSTYESPSLGSLGRYQMFTDWNYTAAQLRGIGRGYPGEVAPLRGNLYQIIRNRNGSALALGDSVSLYFNAATRIGLLTALSTTSVLATAQTLDPELAGSESWPGFIGVTAGAFATTAAEQRRQILANTTAAITSTVTIAQADFSDGSVNGVAANSPDVIATPGATYGYEIFCPWEVVKTSISVLATAVTQGVVCSTTIGDGNYGIAQIQGIAMANVNGTTALVAGDLLQPDAAAGILSKYVFASQPAVNVAGRIFGPYTVAGNGLRMIQLLNRPLFPRVVNP